MNNKPIHKSWDINICLQYDTDSFNLEAEELERKGWHLNHYEEVSEVIKSVELFEDKEKVIRHPDGEEYVYKVYKVYKKTNAGHRDNYPEIMEDRYNFQAILPMLRFAIRANDIEECKILIPRLKYNWINYQDDEGNTFLHFAAIKNANIEICKLLINKMHSVPINVQNDNKLTAYQEAKNRGRTNICELLEDITLEGGKK